MQRLTLPLVTAFCLLSSAARAEDSGRRAPPAEGDTLTLLESLPELQRTARHAIASLGFDLGGDRVTYGPRGRQDILLFSATTRQTIVDTLKSAYRSSRILPGDAEVTGYAHIGLDDTHTFTLRVGRGTTVVQVGIGPSGTELLLWGTLRSAPAPSAPTPPEVSR